MNLSFALVTFIFFSAFSCLHAKTSDLVFQGAGPTCLGEFCFDVNSLDELITASDLIEKFGNGYSEGGKFPVYCFRVPDQHLFARFRAYHGERKQIIDVFVSDVQNCRAAKPPVSDFKPLVTKEGLKIGDSYERVIALYGNPSAADTASGIEMVGITYQEALSSSPFGEVVLRYRSAKEDLLHADIYVRGGKVSAILISLSP